MPPNQGPLPFNSIGSLAFLCCGIVHAQFNSIVCCKRSWHGMITGRIPRCVNVMRLLTLEWGCRAWGWDGGLTTNSYWPCLSACFLAGGCLAGLVGGQDTQQESARTPNPALAVVEELQLVLRAVELHLPGMWRWQRRLQQ
jgi:hypothetical protein